VKICFNCNEFSSRIGSSFSLNMQAENYHYFKRNRLPSTEWPKFTDVNVGEALYCLREMRVGNGLYFCGSEDLVFALVTEVENAEKDQPRIVVELSPCPESNLYMITVLSRLNAYSDRIEAISPEEYSWVIKVFLSLRKGLARLLSR